MKIFFIAFTLIVVTISNFTFAQSFDSEEVMAQIYSDTIKRTGRLEYKRVLNLAFKSSGYLSQLKIDEGQRFEKNQLLASLDITVLKEAKNSTYAQLLQAKREIERIKVLMEDKLASIRDMDSALTQVKTTRAAYQVASYNLDKALIYAPFSGIVLSRNAELGELQSPGKQVLKVAKLDWIVKVSLTGEEVNQIYLNQHVDVSLSFMGVVEGIVSKIPAIANGGGNLFSVEISLPTVKNKTGMIAGQLAGIQIEFNSNVFVYKAPISALVAVDEQGKAVIMTQSKSEALFKAFSFEIFQIDNEYVYLRANSIDESIKIMTNGWQHYTIDEY